MQPLQCDLHPLAAKHEGGTDYDRNDPGRTRRTHELPQPLHTGKHKVSCSSFLPNPSPLQHACSHYNAFCSSTCTFMQPLHCDLHLRVAEHQGETARNDPGRTPPHTQAALHRPLQPLYTAKHHVSCSGFLRNTHAAIIMRCATLCHPLPLSPLPAVTTSLCHHFPWSSHLFLSHHFLSHHFPQSPLPFVIASLSHHSPLSSCPLSHHFP